MMIKIYSRRSKKPITWFLTLFMAVYCIACICMVSGILVEFFGEMSTNSKVLLFFTPVLLLLDVAAVDLVLWQIIGKEIVEISGNGITVSHKGRVFCYKKFIPATSIKSVKNVSNQIDIMSCFWFSRKQSLVEVKYGDNEYIRIGRNITVAECAELFQILESSFPNAQMEINPAPHKLTLNEILLIIWAVGCVFVFIPAWFVVPVIQEKQNKEFVSKHTQRMSFIRKNYKKMYCYSNAYGECCKRVSLLNKQDSVFESSLITLCHIEDSLAHFTTGPYSIPDIMPSNVKMPAYNFFSGLVYVVENGETMSLIFSNSHMIEPVFVLNKYLHLTPPQCSQSNYVKDDYGKLCWDETDEFITSGLLRKLGIY